MPDAAAVSMISTSTGLWMLSILVVIIEQSPPAARIFFSAVGRSTFTDRRLNMSAGTDGQIESRESYLCRCDDAAEEQFKELQMFGEDADGKRFIQLCCVAAASPEHR
jgi:hypothetical protein